jgi:hypothetical protein
MAMRSIGALGQAALGRAPHRHRHGGARLRSARQHARLGIDSIAVVAA